MSADRGSPERFRGFAGRVAVVLAAASATLAWAPSLAAAAAPAAPEFKGAWGTLGSGHDHFHFPSGVAVDDQGHVYVADTNNNRIQEFTAAGAFVKAWGKLGNGHGEFNLPRGVAVDCCDV